MTDAVVITVTGNVFLTDEVAPDRPDLILDLIGATETFAIEIPGLTIYADTHASRSEKRLNLLATFLAYPHTAPIRGDVLVFGHDGGRVPGDVPPEFLTIFDLDLA